MKRNRMLKVWLIFVFALGFVVAVDYEKNETVLAVEGNKVDLPCDISPSSKNDDVALVLWYKDESTTPLYSVDSRRRGLHRAKHYPRQEIEDRASLDLFTHPSVLKLERLKVGDEGKYRCRVDFKIGRSRNSLVKLEITTILCSVPSNPVNGRVFYSSLEYGTALLYECNEGFKLQNDQPRMCSKDGIWSNNQPECIEIRCGIPEAPEQGTVLLSTDEPKVGTLALYSCEEGFILNGATVSKCLKSGNWTFDPPKCLSSCSVYHIEGGEFGQYKTRRYRYRTVQEFKAFQIGERINHGDVVIARCKNGFSLGNKDIEDSTEISCYDGMWSKSFQCSPKICTEDPPPIENGFPVERNLQHGEQTWYRCYRGYSKTKSGKVECTYGKWEGPRPVCSDNRCYMNQLNYPGLLVPQRVHVRNGSSFKLHCEEGYTLSSRENTISCIEGKWNINENPCRIMTCEDDPPSLQNGKIRYFHRQHNSQVNYECDDNYKLVGNSSVQCLYGEWKGQLSSCEPYPECSIDVLKLSLPENVIPDTQDVTSKHVPLGLELELLCKQGLIPTENSKATCNSRGQWEIGNAECILGCRLITNAPSNLIIEPMKNYYRFGEFILVSCPHGQKLTSEVVRLMCMGKSWSDTMPSCTE